MNNQIINSKTTPEMTYSTKGTESNIAFCITDREIKVGSLENTKLMTDAKNGYRKLDAQRQNMNRMNVGESLNMNCEIGFSSVGGLYTAGKEINLSSQSKMSLSQSILEAGGKMTLKTKLLEGDFFVTTKGDVTILSYSTNTWLKGIKIERNPSLGLPFTYFFLGKLNLDQPSTPSRYFVIVGAKSITFQF